MKLEQRILTKTRHPRSITRLAIALSRPRTEVRKVVRRMCVHGQLHFGRTKLGELVVLRAVSP